MVQIATRAGVQTAICALGQQLETQQTLLPPDHPRQAILAYQIQKIRRAIAQKGRQR